ncbi:hypothetical protein EAF00_007628 [Botryotinia globosa]|nr:hypothetical protein EAF00_007628 [Botryotinia globosa]
MLNRSRLEAVSESPYYSIYSFMSNLESSLPILSRKLNDSAPKLAENEETILMNPSARLRDKLSLPSDDEDEYGNPIRRAPVKYPSHLMNRSPSPEPQPAKDYSYLKPLGINDYSSRLSPESEERERLEEIENTKLAVKERAEENEANRIAQAELDREVEAKKAVNHKLQVDYDHKAVTKRATKFEPRYEAENGEGSSKGSGKGSGKEIGRGNAKK